MVPLHQRVVEIVKMIPYGKVLSYGQVALYAGLPRSAREVGWALSSINEAIPWWRVVNNVGLISISGSDLREKQRKLLEAEGIEVAEDYRIAMDRYRFQPSDDQLRKLHLSEAYIKTIIKTKK